MEGVPSAVEASGAGGGAEVLGAALTDLFERLRAELERNAAAVLIVRESDLLGHGDVFDAALANAALGLARTAAIEGRREGWSVSVVATGPDGAAPDGAVAILAGDQLPSGQLLQLGDAHLGRQPL